MQLTYAVHIPPNLSSQILQVVEARAEDALDELTDKALEHAQQLLSIPFPPASMPGESPHKRTGQLQRSGGTMPAEKLKRELRFTATYAVYLELGTVKMAARPYMRPTARKALQLAPGIFRKHLGGR